MQQLGLWDTPAEKPVQWLKAGDIFDLPYVTGKWDLKELVAYVESKKIEDMAVVNYKYGRPFIAHILSVRIDDATARVIATCRLELREGYVVADEQEDEEY